MELPERKSSYEVIQSERLDFAEKNFIEVQLKKFIDDKKEVDFIYITKGYYKSDNTPQYEKFFTLPNNPEVKKFLSEKLKEL